MTSGTGSNGIQRPPTTALDDVLGEGRSLVRNWERMNGCANASMHLDSDYTTLQAMIGAVDNLVGLYEMLGEAASLFAATRPGGRDSRRDSPREWPTYASEAYTPDTNTGAISSRPLMNPSSGFSGHNMGNFAQPAAYLGTHRLDDEEAVLVAREAVRHSVMLLGELLHDIERDFDEELVKRHCHNADAAIISEAAGKVSARLLRFLGRINSLAERV